MQESTSGKPKKWWWIGGGIVALLIIIMVVGSVFAGASVAITPRQAAINLDTSFTASFDPAPGMVGFEVVTVTKDATRTVKATGSETISRPASGTIIVYNDTDTAQKFIKKNNFLNELFANSNRAGVALANLSSRPAKRGAGVPEVGEGISFAQLSGAKDNFNLFETRAITLDRTVAHGGTFFIMFAGLKEAFEKSLHRIRRNRRAEKMG